MNTPANADQAEYWKGQVNWVTHQDTMDATLRPVLDLVLDRAALRPGEAVLDIGCGTGDSTLRAAQAVGPEGHVLGLDISPTLLDAANARLAGMPQADTREADAQTHDFARRFDALISRFGVMFFSDTTAAFANIAKGLEPGARLVFAAWGDVRENPFFMVPAKVAQARLGQMPKADRTQPGPFAFEDHPRIAGLLRDAGLRDVAVDEVTVHLTPPGRAADAAYTLSYIGPVNATLTHFEGTEDDRAAIRADLAEALAAFDSDTGLRIPACINLYTARAPD